MTRLEEKVASQLEKTYKSLDPWQKTLVARHPARPHFVDYIDHLVEDFTLYPVIAFILMIRRLLPGLGVGRADA